MNNIIYNSDKENWPGLENVLNSTFKGDIGMLCFLGVLNNYFESSYFRNKAPVSKNISGENLSEKIYKSVENISDSFDSLKLKDSAKNTINELVNFYFPFIKKAIPRRVSNAKEHVTSGLSKGSHYNTPGSMYTIGHKDSKFFEE